MAGVNDSFHNSSPRCNHLFVSHLHQRPYECWHKAVYCTKPVMSLTQQSTVQNHWRRWHSSLLYKTSDVFDTAVYCTKPVTSLTQQSTVQNQWRLWHSSLVYKISDVFDSAVYCTKPVTSLTHQAGIFRQSYSNPFLTEKNVHLSSPQYRTAPA